MEKSTIEWVHDLYNKKAPYLYKIAYYRLHDAELAQDVVQDVFLALLSKVEIVKKYDNPSAWLVQALNYVILHECERANNQKKREVQMDAFDKELSEYMENRHSIDELLPNDFPKNDAQILKFYYEERLSYEEISETLHIPISTCGTWLYRAKQRLKKRILK